MNCTPPQIQLGKSTCAGMVHSIIAADNEHFSDVSLSCDDPSPGVALIAPIKVTLCYKKMYFCAGRR